MSFFARFAVQVLLATQIVKSAMSILRQWEQTWTTVERAVARGKARKEAREMPRRGIDKTSFLQGQNYVTLLHDPDNSTVDSACRLLSLNKHWKTPNRFVQVQRSCSTFLYSGHAWFRTIRWDSGKRSIPCKFILHAESFLFFGPSPIHPPVCPNT